MNNLRYGNVYIFSLLPEELWLHILLSCYSLREIKSWIQVHPFFYHLYVENRELLRDRYLIIARDACYYINRIGLLHGPYERYDDDHKIVYQAYYIDGKLWGKVSRYTSTCLGYYCSRIEYYQDGQLQGHPIEYYCTEEGNILPKP